MITAIETSNETKIEDKANGCKACSKCARAEKKSCSFKGKSETASYANKIANEQSLVMRMPVHAEILNDKDIWIADSGAALHNTPCSAGLQDITKPLETDTVTAGTGAKAGAAKVRTTKGSTHNKCSDAVIQNASLQDAIVVPGSKFDLLRIPVFLEKGLQLKGNKECIKLIKDTIEIEFDMKIKTTRGALCCAKFARKAAGEKQRGCSHRLV